MTIGELLDNIARLVILKKIILMMTGYNRFICFKKMAYRYTAVVFVLG